MYELYLRIEGVARVLRGPVIIPPFTMAQLVYIDHYVQLVEDLHQFLHLSFGIIPNGRELVESDDEGYSSTT